MDQEARRKDTSAAPQRAQKHIKCLAADFKTRLTYADYRPMQTPARAWFVLCAVACLAVLLGCGGADPVTTPSVVTSPPATTAAPVPPPVASTAFTIDMPLDPSDVSTELGGLAPFGAHFADHGEDGHPGWDIGFRVGGIVRAAAEGVVQSVTPIGGSSQSTVQIFHRIGDRTYRTVYVGVESVRPSVTPDAPVRAGDPLGLAGVITAMVGSSRVARSSNRCGAYRHIPRSSLNRTRAIRATSHGRSCGSGIVRQATSPLRSSSHVAAAGPPSSNIAGLVRTASRVSQAPRARCHGRHCRQSISSRQVGPLRMESTR
jgi:hypothetical protein